jgi:hypothetical protein
MPDLTVFTPDVFSAALYEKLQPINPGIAGMELYEFRYALHNLYPDQGGWAAVELEGRAVIEQRVNSRAFYDSLQIKPRRDNRIVLDENITFGAHASGGPGGNT